MPGPVVIPSSVKVPTRLYILLHLPPLHRRNASTEQSTATATALQCGSLQCSPREEVGKGHDALSACLDVIPKVLTGRQVVQAVHVQRHILPERAHALQPNAGRDARTDALVTEGEAGGSSQAVRARTATSRHHRGGAGKSANTCFNNEPLSQRASWRLRRRLVRSLTDGPAN